MKAEEEGVMFCSKCGARISDDSNFCYKCGNKISVNKEQESMEKKVFDKEEIKNKLIFISTFLQDISSSRFYMSKKEYTTSKGLEDYSNFLNGVLKCTEKNYKSDKYVTRKNIEEFASDVDCILHKLFQKYPELKYSENIRKLHEYWKEWKEVYTIDLSDLGQVVWYHEVYDENSEWQMVKEELSLYDCFQKEFFSPLDEFRELYGKNWNVGDADKIKERTDVLFSPRIVLSTYKEVWGAIMQELFWYIDSNNEKANYIMNLLEKYPADRVMDYERRIYEKKYKHFGIDCISNSLNLEQDETILEFEMWDAEDVTNVSFTVENNDYYDEVKEQYFPDLFTFDLIEFEETGEWSEEREGFINIIRIKMIGNYFAEVVGGLDLGTITFWFDTNVKSKSKEKVDVNVINTGYDFNNDVDIKYIQEINDNIENMFDELKDYLI